MRLTPQTVTESSNLLLFLSLARCTKLCSGSESANWWTSSLGAPLPSRWAGAGRAERTWDRDTEEEEGGESRAGGMPWLPGGTVTKFVNRCIVLCDVLSGYVMWCVTACDVMCCDVLCCCSLCRSRCPASRPTSRAPTRCRVWCSPTTPAWHSSSPPQSTSTWLTALHSFCLADLALCINASVGTLHETVIMLSCTYLYTTVV